jgi:hypothetical protein
MLPKAPGSSLAERVCHQSRPISSSRAWMRRERRTGTALAYVEDGWTKYPAYLGDRSHDHGSLHSSRIDHHSSVHAKAVRGLIWSSENPDTPSSNKVCGSSRGKNSRKPPPAEKPAKPRLFPLQMSPAARRREQPRTGLIATTQLAIWPLRRVKWNYLLFTMQKNGCNFEACSHSPNSKAIIYTTIHKVNPSSQRF